jgi:hypothetical protein
MLQSLGFFFWMEVTLTLHDDWLRRNLLRNIPSTALNKLQIFQQSRPFLLPYFEK